jgi:hypothetical protein
MGFASSMRRAASRPAGSEYIRPHELRETAVGMHRHERSDKRSYDILQRNLTGTVVSIAVS